MDTGGLRDERVLDIHQIGFVEIDDGVVVGVETPVKLQVHGEGEEREKERGVMGKGVSLAWQVTDHSLDSKKKAVLRTIKNS